MIDYALPNKTRWLRPLWARLLFALIRRIYR
jgi:hypothetical protein